MSDQKGDKANGISPEIYRQLHSTLITCGPFSSDDELQAIFVDKRIYPWRNWLPQASSTGSRVEATIDFLYNRYSSTQENALALFVNVLRDRIEPNDTCYGQLAKLAGDLTRKLEADFSSEGKAESPLDILPRKSYSHFTGRAEELAKVLEVLKNPDQYQLIGIYGLGGIGKTVLARELLSYCQDQNLFQHIVWMSAKAERFEGDGTHRLPVSDFSFNDLLSEIARQCNLAHLAKLPFENKLAGIQHILTSRPVLLVLDNMETVKNCEELIGQFVNILANQTKVLLTSRRQITRTNTFEIHLQGLSPKDGEVFLRREGRGQGAIEVAGAPSDVLQNIAEVCGGAPLAMKLVVGQLKRQSLQTVLNNLSKVTFDGPDYDFYRFIYKHSWDLLGLDAKKVLVSMSVFDLESGGGADMMRQVSSIEQNVFEDAIVELVVMSLVNLIGQLGQRRYTLHQLTYYFILSDIVKKWG